MDFSSSYLILSCSYPPLREMEGRRKKNQISNLDFTDLELGVGLVRYYLIFLFQEKQRVCVWVINSVT